MNWSAIFAERVSAMRRSTVRELLKAARRPGVISLAGGLPAEELLPKEAVGVAVESVLARPGRSPLQYGETEGVLELREWIAAHSPAASGSVTPENVLIVSGSQQGLDLLGRVFLEEGDGVAVENPTYLAALGAWRPWSVRFQPLRLIPHAGGVLVEEAHSLRESDGSGGAMRPLKLGYCIPNFQNPTGASLAGEERRAWVEWAARRGVALVEDDPYGALRYDGEALPSLRELAGESVIQLGSFSKVLAPGLRVGWLIAPVPVIERLTLAKQSVDLHTSTFNQEVILELLQRNFLEGHLTRLRAQYRERRDALLAALERHLTGLATWARPAGGLFVFVRLRAGIDARALLPAALEAGVAFVPGADFHCDGTGAETLRLNFSQVAPAQLEEGVRRLGEALRQSPARAPRGVAGGPQVGDAPAASLVEASA